MGLGRAVDPADGPEEEVICRGGSGVSLLVTRCCISSRVLLDQSKVVPFHVSPIPYGRGRIPKMIENRTHPQAAKVSCGEQETLINQ